MTLNVIEQVANRPSESYHCRTVFDAELGCENVELTEAGTSIDEMFEKAERARKA
jgi:hypothetical protein